MNEVDIVGQVIGGEFGDIVIREKSGKNLEIGDLLVSEEDNGFLILQVFPWNMAVRLRKQCSR